MSRSRRRRTRVSYEWALDTGQVWFLLRARPPPLRQSWCRSSETGQACRSGIIASQDRHFPRSQLIRVQPAVMLGRWSPERMRPTDITIYQGRHFNFYLGGKNFFIFECHRTIEKLEKKQHFICSNLTLFIVPFFLFFSFFSLFSFFLLFFFFLGGGATAPQPLLNDASAIYSNALLKSHISMVAAIHNKHQLD